MAERSADWLRQAEFDLHVLVAIPYHSFGSVSGRDLCRILESPAARGNSVKKRDMVELLEDMPEEIDTEELIYRIYLNEKIKASEAAAAAGDVLPHDEVIKLSDEWLK